MRLLIDGVAFQQPESQGARIWESILPALAAQDGLDVMVLDRGGLPAADGVKRIPFPTHKHRYTADDSELIQRVCDFHAIDVFTSTRHTTPLSTPMLLVVHEPVPDPPAAGAADRGLQEQAIAIAYARRHVCVSVRTRDDLLRACPTLDRVDVAPVGIDHAVFRPVDRDRVAAFRRRIGFDRRPYLVAHDRQRGEPGREGDPTMLFDTVARFGIDAFDILCIGGDPAIGGRLTAMLPATVRVERIEASGEDLAVALSGAAALVHPSRCEGLGLPVLEAMACGCPVVTTAQAALPGVLAPDVPAPDVPAPDVPESDMPESEVSDPDVPDPDVPDPEIPGPEISGPRVPRPEVLEDAWLIFDGTSRAGLAGALAQLRSEAVQGDLRDAGLRRAAPFDWSPLVAAIAVAARETAALGDDADYRAFAQAWQSLRRMQAAVDADTWVPSA